MLSPQVLIKMKQVNKNTTLWIVVLATVFSVFLSAPTSLNLKAANAEPHRKTIDAIEICMGRAKQAIEKGTKAIPLISCNIPFSLNETELDSLIKNAVTNPSLDKKANQENLNSAKSYLNIRSLNCLAKVRVKNSSLRKAIDIKQGQMNLSPQWVTCNLKTNNKSQKNVRFSFRPIGKFADQCLKSFSPRMGEFNIDCTVCRLNMLAQSLSFWVNKIGSQMTPGINRALGKACKT